MDDGRVLVIFEAEFGVGKGSRRVLAPIWKEALKQGFLRAMASRGRWSRSIPHSPINRIIH